MNQERDLKGERWNVYRPFRESKGQRLLEKVTFEYRFEEMRELGISISEVRDSQEIGTMGTKVLKWIMPGVFQKQQGGV